MNAVSLIQDIQAAAISETTEIATILRMCKLLAARISHEQFAKWVNEELNGYPNIKSLPDYRVVRVESYGSFIGTFARADRLQIPVSVLPEDLQDAYRNAYMGGGISAYTALLDGDKANVLHEDWPISLSVRYASKIASDMQCVAAWKEIPIAAVARLVDSVKTRVLGFAIDLERESPNAGDTPIGSKPPISMEKMTQIFNNNIFGSVGNMSNSGENFSQVATVNVGRGNWEDLEKILNQIGLSPSDMVGMRDELSNAIDASASEKKALAGAWIGKLIGKFAAGVSGVGVEVASAGIAKAITAYLGV